MNQTLMNNSKQMRYQVILLIHFNDVEQSMIGFLPQQQRSLSALRERSNHRRYARSGHRPPRSWRSDSRWPIGGAVEGGEVRVAGDFEVGWLRARREGGYAVVPSLPQICSIRSRYCKKKVTPKLDAAAVEDFFLPLAAASGSYSAAARILQAVKDAFMWHIGKKIPQLRHSMCHTKSSFSKKTMTKLLVRGKISHDPTFHMIPCYHIKKFEFLSFKKNQKQLCVLT
jgi:hypothetical protein